MITEGLQKLNEALYTMTEGIWTTPE